MVSVIIPVYNTHPYHLERCIQSIQQVKNGICEILLIDDGSTEKACRDFLQEISRKNREICVLAQKHKGVSAARNLGLENARGEYIAFVDADDEVMGGFPERALCLAQRYRLDIVYGSLFYEPDKGLGLQGSRKFRIFEHKEIFEIKKSLLEMKKSSLDTPVLGSPCGRLYRAELLRHIRFDEEVRICEDQLFNLYALDGSKQVGICPEYWYRYYQNAGSVMNSMKNKKELFSYYIRLNQYAVSDTNMEVRRRIQDKTVGYLSVLSGYISHEKISVRKRCRKIKRLAASPLFSEAIEGLKGRGRQLPFTHRLRWKTFYSRNYLLIYLFQRLFR